MTPGESSSTSARAVSAESALLPPVVLAWIGVIISALLLPARSDVRMLLCPARSGCDAVLGSSHSSLAGVPLPWVGLAFYLGLLALLLVAYASRAGKMRASIVGATVWMCVAALAFSGMLMWVQFGVLHAFCALCTASAVTVAALVWATLRAERLCAAASGGHRGVAIALGLVAVLAAAALVLPSLVGAEEIVARVDGRVFTRAQMDADLAGEMLPLRRSIYEREVAWVQETVDAELLETTAKARGISVEALLAGRPKEAVLPEIAAGRQIEIRLTKPPLRGLKFDLSKAHVTGPATARVQLVVFSDFQCQFCIQLAPVLEKVRADFPQEVQVAFRPYPLDANPQSRAAAIAAEAAAEQGAFWKYHDRLFAARGDLSEERLTGTAQEFGLDAAKFQADRASAAAAQRVEESYREAVKLGLEGAPALFLNGDLIGGFVAYEALAERIRAALKAK